VNEEDRLCAEALRQGISFVPTKKKIVDWIDEQTKKRRTSIGSTRGGCRWEDAERVNEASKPVAGPIDRVQASIGSTNEHKNVDRIDE